MNKMPIKEERSYRPVVEFRAAEDEGFIVEGYATTFNDPYVLYSFDGVDYKESIDRRAFDDADMTDVIMQYDHDGKVFARTSNNTLQLKCDEHGMKVRADLSHSAAARDMYEEIKSGLVTKMSFAFTVTEDSYNKEEHCRNITKIKKVYDVSAVSIPANPGTEISARNYFEGVIEAEKAERLRAEEDADMRMRIKIKSKEGTI